MTRSKKNFDGDPGGLIGEAIFSVIKPLYKEGEKAKRAARRVPKTYYAPEPKTSQKEIVFGVMRQAIANAGTNFSGRDLYYAVRPLAYAHDDWEHGRELKFPYLSQTLLTEYQEWHGPIPGLWRDPRGNFHEPHTGNCISLGTREVGGYVFPEHTFDKILYVEKEGEWPKFQAAKLAERYDLAIASSKGYPVEAARELFAHAEGGDYQLFVFHDADIDGYEIARVLGNATRRMPNHSVDVIDIGLNIADAVEMELDSEPYYRKGGLPYHLRRRMTELEWGYFSGRHGYRFELNAILPDSRRIEYIERKLEENGVRGKVIPPDEKLGELAKEKYRKEHAERVSRLLDEILDLNDIKEVLAEEFEDKFELDAARSAIEDGFKEDPALSWRKALENNLRATLDKHNDSIKDAVREKAIEALNEEEGAS